MFGLWQKSCNVLENITIFFSIFWNGVTFLFQPEEFQSVGEAVVHRHLLHPVLLWRHQPIFVLPFCLLFPVSTKTYCITVKLGYNERKFWSQNCIDPVITNPGYNQRIWPIPSCSLLPRFAVQSILSWRPPMKNDHLTTVTWGSNYKFCNIKIPLNNYNQSKKFRSLYTDMTVFVFKVCFVS